MVADAAQVRRFGLYSRSAAEWVCENDTLESAMRDVADCLGDRGMHKYFPITIQLEDTYGTVTDICTVTLA